MSHRPTQALNDLDGLIQQAKECISVVQKYAALSSNNENTNSLASGSEAGSEILEMENIMANIGNTSRMLIRVLFSVCRHRHRHLPPSPPNPSLPLYQA
jgi:hypothetical protein